MKSLKVLHASDSCGIDQNGIKNLDLVKLDASYNHKITNVSFMKSLKVLYIGNGRIDQNGIKKLDLVELVEKKLKHCFNFF